MGKSRGFIVAVMIVSTLLLPALLCAALALAPARSALELALLTAGAAAAMATLALVNWWEFTGLFLRGAWAGLLLAIALGRWAGASRGAPAGWALGAPGIAGAVLLLLAAAVIAPALRARRHPGDAIELAFPLRGGTFLVTDGGDGAASFLVNYHFGFGAHRGAGVSASMRYATDVVEIGPLGAEAPWLVPARNEAYRIWGRTVHAPCDGVVARAVDEVEDNAAFGAHRPYGVGNQVVIRAGDVHVVLGHLRRGSVQVKAGDEVRAGQPIGVVGNSGWTERPHLHFQAMRAPDGDFWHGAPVPMRFGGRFLAKNQTVRTDPPDAAG